MKYVSDNRAYFGHAIRLEFHEYWTFYNKVPSSNVLKCGTWYLKPEMQQWMSQGLIVNPDIFASSFTQLNIKRVFDVHFTSKDHAMVFKLVWA